MAVLNNPIVPEGSVTAIVDALNFVFRVQTKEFGEIEVTMTSIDQFDDDGTLRALAVGDRVYVIPLAGGKVIGAVPNLVGLGSDFINKEVCAAFGGLD